MIAAIALLVGSMATSPQGPDRLFDCTMGKVTNMAATSEAEMGLVGAHRIILLQPDGAVEYEALPPRGAEAVRLVKFADPDRILPTRYLGGIADTWPAKIEVSTVLPKRQRMFVTIGGIDLAAGTATGSAGLIDDASETVVEGRFYQGKCSVEVAPRLTAKFDTLKAAAEKGTPR